MPSSWRCGKSGQRRIQMGRTYADHDTLNSGVLFQGNGAAHGATLAVARNFETRDLWAKGYFDVTTVTPVVDGIASVGQVGGCSAICDRAIHLKIWIGWRRLGSFNEDL